MLGSQNEMSFEAIKVLKLSRTKHHKNKISRLMKTRNEIFHRQASSNDCARQALFSVNKLILKAKGKEKGKESVGSVYTNI